jgi:hypothetical protein
MSKVKWFVSSPGGKHVSYEESALLADGLIVLRVTRVSNSTFIPAVRGDKEYGYRPRMQSEKSLVAAKMAAEIEGLVVLRKALAELE